MKKVIALSVALLTLSAMSLTAGEELTMDAEKSTIEFVGSKPDGKHKGGFKKFTAKVEADWDTPQNSKLAIEIDTASLFSDDEKLTAHLKNPDFFNVRKFPKATFVATNIEPTEEGAGVITGKFKLLEKEKEIKIPITFMADETSLTIKSKFEINRMDYGMNYGAGKINDKVKLAVNLALKRP